MKQDMDKEQWEDFLTAWKEQHGTKSYSKKYGTPYMGVPKNPEKRREMFVILIDSLVEMKGLEASDFNTFTKGIIVEACVFRDFLDLKVLNQWRAHVRQDLNIALATVFKQEFVVKNRVKEDKPEEESQYLDPAEEVKLKNPLDKSTLGDFAVPEVVPDLDFLKQLEALEGNDE